jgi:hypothetical protein
MQAVIGAAEHKVSLTFDKLVVLGIMAGSTFLFTSILLHSLKYRHHHDLEPYHTLLWRKKTVVAQQHQSRFLAEKKFVRADFQCRFSRIFCVWDVKSTLQDGPMFHSLRSGIEKHFFVCSKIELSFDEEIQILLNVTWVLLHSSAKLSQVPPPPQIPK